MTSGHPRLKKKHIALVDWKEDLSCLSLSPSRISELHCELRGDIQASCPNAAHVDELQNSRAGQNQINIHIIKEC
jgi:hypothetical protein